MMKILCKHIVRLLLWGGMLLGSLHVMAQPVFEDLNKLSKAIEQSSKSNLKSAEESDTSDSCGQDDCEDAIYIGNQNTPGITVPSDIYSSEIILHSDGTVDGTSTVDYKSNYVRLDIGFSTDVGADFSAEIEACVEGVVDDSSQGGEGDDANCPDQLYVGNGNTPGATIPSEVYAAGTTLESDGTVAVPDNVEQKAGYQVTLTPGFKALAGSVFRGYIESCAAGDYYVNDASQLGDIYTTAPGVDAASTAGTPSNPYATLKYVIEVVNPPVGSTIYIDSGVYDDTFITLNTPDLTIRGAGSFNTIFDNNYTDNDIEADDVSVGNLFMRVYADGTSLEGFTVREYNYIDLDSDSNISLDGKAISVRNAQCVVFEDISITHNVAYNGGSGLLSFTLFTFHSSVNILNSSISHNTSTEDEMEGGGILMLNVENINSPPSNIENTVISGNTSLSDWSSGLFAIGVDLNIDNCEISNNIAKGAAGGIAFALGNLNINNSCISNNHVINQYESRADGGGMYVGTGASVNIYNTVFDSNIAGGAHPSQGKGGAIYIEDENKGNDPNEEITITVKLERCKFENNQAAEGDHIYATECRLDANDVQFLPETEAIFNLTDATLYIQNSGTPETSSTISFINNNVPQNYATPLCASQTDCIADAGFDQTICPGESVQIGTAPEDDRTYYWEPPTGLDDPYAANPTASPSETTTYTLHVGGCGRRGSEDEVTVYVSTGDVTFPPDEVTCGNTDILLTIGGGAEYQWTPATGLSCTDCPNPVANVAQTTTYTVTVTDNNGCEITRDITITVAGNLNVSIGSDDQDGVICPGQQVQLTASGAMTYIWSSADGGLSNPNIPNPIVSPTATTTYTVTGFQDECHDTDQITLHVASEYDVSIGYNLDGCTIDFTAISSAPLNTYEWIINGDVIEEATNASTFGYGFTHNDTYEVSLTVTGQCGEEVTVYENVAVDDCICLDADIFDCPDLMVNVGHPCDDGNANTVGDTYNELCICEGIDCSLVELLDVDEQLPSAINYGILSYSGDADNNDEYDYIIEWREGNGAPGSNVAFVSAAGSYYNSNIHESHPPASNVPVPAGTYTPVIVAANPPGLMGCTLPTYTVGNYTCTGEEHTVSYQGPPGVTRIIEVDLDQSESECNLYIFFKVQQLIDDLEILGVDVNGTLVPIYDPLPGGIRDVIPIPSGLQSLRLVVTSIPGGINTNWELDFDCCFTPCCDFTYGLRVDESSTDCSDCILQVYKNNYSSQGCYLAHGGGTIKFDNQSACSVVGQEVDGCNSLQSQGSLTIEGGEITLEFNNDTDYNYFKNTISSLTLPDNFTEATFVLEDVPCGDDYFTRKYIMVTSVNEVDYDPVNHVIKVDYNIPYDECVECVITTGNHSHDDVLNGSLDVTDFIFYSTFQVIKRKRVRLPIDYGPFETNYYVTSPGCDGHLDKKQIRLSIQDENCPCESWILEQDTDENGIYETTVDEAEGWIGVCSQSQFKN